MNGLTSLINRINLLKQIPIFEKLNWFDLQKIARKSIVIECKKGDMICKEGNPPDFFYCLVSGRLQAYTNVPDGGKENVDFIHRGMYFGVISVLTGENHSMSFEAINDSVVLKVPKDDFQAILKTIPYLGVELSQHLSRRIRRNVKGGKSVFESTVISVYSPIKGVGSSTYAANLALSLQKETGKKVIYVNIFSKRGKESKATTIQDEATPSWRKPAIDLNDIIGEHEKILESATKNDLAIDLLNVMFDPEDLSLKDAIGSFVSAFVEDYHYVVVDLPNEMDQVVLEALTQSDMVHLVASDREKDLELTRRVVDQLEKRLKGHFSEERIRVIIRMFHFRAGLTSDEISKQIDYHVFSSLPDLKRSELTQRIDTPSLTFLRPDFHNTYAKAVTHIARQIGGVSIGLALGGGAALGIAHIGVLRVLEQEDIPVDMVVGSSMGALIGSLWVTGHGSDDIEKIAKEFEHPLSKIKLFDPPLIPISGIIRGGAIKGWLKRHFGNRTFYDVRMALKVVSYDLVRREEIVIDSGSIVEAVAKSIAIPGVFRPVQDKERVIIDGGVLNPLPTNVLAACGIKKIIAVNVLQSPMDVSQGIDMTQEQVKVKEKIMFRKAPLEYLRFKIGRAFAKPFNPNISDIIIQTLQACGYVIAEQSGQQADVVIHPDLVGIKWHQIDRVDDLIKRGEESARKLIPQIKALIES
ncbi:MAG: cyclic nucleotide-binding domain-containing protein [Candidatus Omnitrophica bacterium]|nr:cyclic nucleotide-binding domain-containing protein [Candidatus Omnitrophota bacterium]